MPGSRRANLNPQPDSIHGGCQIKERPGPVAFPMAYHLAPAVSPDLHPCSRCDRMRQLDRPSRATLVNRRPGAALFDTLAIAVVKPITVLGSPHVRRCG